MDGPMMAATAVHVRRIYDRPDPADGHLTATRDVEHSQAAVLAARLARAR
jgi:uncharacterized protein YeaO (DUF488 family)